MKRFNVHYHDFIGFENLICSWEKFLCGKRKRNDVALMNEFDQFVKRDLKVNYYLRYADDFVIFCDNRNLLKRLLTHILDFLTDQLKLSSHPDKVFIKTWASGIDFLGWVHFPYHRVLRTSTRRRMQNRIEIHPKQETIGAYLGMLKHGNTYKIREQIKP